MKKTLSWELTLAISNLLFVGTYSLLAVHALFFYSGSTEQELRPAILLGMAVFSSSQVGGVWLLSLIHQRATTSIPLLISFRTLAIILLLVPNSICLVLGFLLFGLSHSIFYKVSRTTMAAYHETKSSNSSHGYLLFSLTTNLAFVVFPFLGSYFIQNSNFQTWGALCSFAFLIPSVLILQKSKSDFFKITTDKKTEHKETEPHQSNDRWMPILKDVLRFVGFVLPYSIMIPIISIKASSAGLSPLYNSAFLSLNSFIILSVQIASLKFKITEFSTLKFDLSCLMAVAISIFSLFLNIWTIVPLFAFWSLLEAYQMPNLDHYLFTQRKYSGKKLDNLLALDAVFCFIGPFVAALSLPILSDGSPALENFIKKTVESFAGVQ